MFADYILVQLNGKPFNCLLGTSLKDLLLYLGYISDSVVVEYNKVIISDSDLGKIEVKRGDVIEIVTMVGGG